MDAPVREFIVQIKPSLAHFEFREHDLLAVGRHAPADFYGAESLLVKPDCFCRIAYNQMRRDGMDCRFRMFRGGRHVSSFCSDVSEMLPKTPASLPLVYSSAPLPSSTGWRDSLRAASALRAIPYFVAPALRFFPKYPRRSSNAPATKGSATVASSKTSANRPPSSGGTNLPQETASVYVLPLSPPQCTGSGQMRTP